MKKYIEVSVFKIFHINLNLVSVYMCSEVSCYRKMDKNGTLFEIVLKTSISFLVITEKFQNLV